MKKTLALLLTLVMAMTLLSACGDKPAPAGSAAGDTTGLPGEGMKIALVCDKVGTQPFLIQMVEGLDAAAAKYGFEANVAECADSAQYEENIRALVAEEYDLIIGGGWQAADPINKIAGEMPDACDYALIDSTVESEKVKCVSYREQEGAYLIGMMAGLTVDGESHTYGAVHVSEGPSSFKWRWGFMEGVRAIDPEANFVFNYVGSYSDPAKAKELSIQQYEQGCLFVNSAAAGGDSGTFEAAKEKNFYTSGQDVDLTDPNNAYIVSSQIKDTYQSVVNLVDEYFGGSWTTENSVWGIKEGTIGAIHITHDTANPRNERLSDEDIEQVKAASAAIAAGELDLSVVPEESSYDANIK